MLSRLLFANNYLINVLLNDFLLIYLVWLPVT